MKRLLAISFLVLFANAFAADSETLKSGEFNPPRSAPDFVLRGSDGKDLQLSRYKGKVIILGFGFSSCPEICPTTLAELAAARKQLGAEGKDLQVVYVTVDPERDTVERLKDYVTGFDPSFIGATGTSQQLAGVRKAYGISAVKKLVNGGPDYTVHHSSFVYLIDREGKIRGLSLYGRKVDDLVHDVRVLLRK